MLVSHSVMRHKASIGYFIHEAAPGCGRRPPPTLSTEIKPRWLPNGKHKHRAVVAGGRAALLLFAHQNYPSAVRALPHALWQTLKEAHKTSPANNENALPRKRGMKRLDGGNIDGSFLPDCMLK